VPEGLCARPIARRPVQKQNAAPGARHWLGAALIEANRHADAERVYRQELGDHPHNGWSLFGLKQALTAQGKSDPGVDEDLAQSWARSDTWLRSSRF